MKQQEINIQRLESLDARQLDLLCRYGTESMGPAALDEWQLPVIAKWGILFVAELGDEIIGSAQLIRCRQEADIYMDIFYIRPRYRRHGHGRCLMENIKERLGADGYRRLLVTIDPENEAAVQLYESSGFTRVERLDDFYGKWRHRRVMAAGLGDPAVGGADTAGPDHDDI